jgi:hypothetical protein
MPGRHRIAGLVITGLLGCGATAQAQGGSGDALKIINPPGGGQVVYGTMEAGRTPQAAMAFMLKQVHGHFGDRPQVSKVFQVRNSESYAAFFTLIAKTQGGKPIAGEVIVSVPKGRQPSAAVLYDDAQHFTKSQAVLLKALSTGSRGDNSAGGPGQASQGQAAPGQSAAGQSGLGKSQALRVQTGGDHSASLTLPEGWRVVSVAGGSISAEGPNGERIGLGLMAQGIRDPRSAGGVYGMPGMRGVVCPAGGDLFNAYVCVVNQQRRNANQPQGTFTLKSSRPLGGGAIEAIFEVDLHDGKGPRDGSARLQALITRGLPTWALSISNSSVPKTVAAAEAPTMKAILASYSQDRRVINGEQRQVLGQIRAAGERSRIEADAANQRREASTSAFDAHMDNIDRQSKAMQNYTLDRSQIQDNDLNGRATVSNGLADALVATDPNRYQVVPPGSFLKGVDY